MVGHGEIFVAERETRRHHRLDRVPAVAPVAVQVQVTSDVGATDQQRQGAGIGGADRLVALAKFRRYQRKTERLVDGGFGGGDTASTSGHQTVDVQTPATVSGPPLKRLKMNGIAGHAENQRAGVIR